MSDRTEEEIIYNESPLQQPRDIAEDSILFKAEDERQQRIATTHNSNNNAFLREAMKNNTLVNVLNSASEWAHAPEPDPTFTIDDDTVDLIMKDNKFPQKYWGELRQSKSQDEVTQKTLKFRQEDYYDNVINNTLSENARISAVAVGNIADIEVVGGIAIGGLYSINANIAKVAMYEGAFEASMAVTNYVTDEEYTVEDGFIDTMFGTVLASGAANLARSLDNTRAAVIQKDTYSQSVARTSEDLSNGNYSFTEGFETKINPANGEVEFTKIAPDDGVVRGVAREHVADDIVRGVGRVSREGDNVVLTKSGKVVPTEEVTRIEANRENFFVKQSKTEEKFDVIRKTHTDNLRASEDTISSLNTKLNDLKAKGATKKQTYTTRRKIEAEREKLKITKNAIDELDTVKPTSKEIELQEQVDLISEDLVNAKIELEDVIKTGKAEDLSELKEVTEELSKQMPDEFKAIKDMLKSKLNSKTLPARFKNLSPKQKKILAGAGIVFAGTSASATEDGGETAISVGAVMMLAIAGVAFGTDITRAISKIKNANIRNYMNKAVASVVKAGNDAEMATSQEGRALTKTRAVVADSIHTRFTSTVAPFIKAGGKAKEIATKLLYSAQFGAGAETLKHNWVRSAMGKYAQVEKGAYRAWKIENKITGFNSIVDETHSIERFRKEVSKQIELGTSTSPSVKEVAKQSEELFKDMLTVNKDYGTLGFDKIEHKAGYLPRLWNGGKIKALLSGMSDDDIMILRDKLAEAIDKTARVGTDKSRVTADNFIKGWSAKQIVRSSNDAEDIYGRLGHLLKEDADFEDFTDALTVYGDRSSRAKYKVDFDINDFDEVLRDVKFDVNGAPTNFTIDNFVDRDIKSILDKTANNMYSSAALSSRGYKSVRALTREIDEFVKDDALNQELHQVVKLITGDPMDVTSPTMHNLSMMAKDLTIFAKLPLVALSTPTEIIHTLGNHGFMRSAKAVIASVGAQFGRDSYMMKQLSDLTGLGTSTARLDFHHYGYSDDMVSLDDAGVASMLRQGTMKLRDAVILMSGLSNINDVLQRANLALNAEQFAKYIDSGEGILISRLESYGINASTRNLFKNSFKFNEKGALQDIDMSGWSRQKKDKFSEVLMDMNQQYTPETTIGETPLFSKTNDLGRAITTLTSYSLHQFNVHGIQDIRTLDRVGFLHTVGALGGTYLGLHGRYAIQDKEVDDEQLLLYSLMNQPQLLGLAAIKSMLDPAVVQTTRSASEVIGMR